MKSRACVLSLIALTAVVLPRPAFSQEGGSLALLEAASQRYGASSALCADFVQELYVPLLRQRHTGKGLLCQKQPNLFMMRFSEPVGDRIVADGQYLWVYTPSTDAKLVSRVPLGSAPGSFDFHREFLESPATKYRTSMDGQETLDGSATTRVLLVPLKPAGYREAVLWIDTRQFLVRRVEVREENGSVRTVSLTNIKLNALPAADAFRFVQPPGTQIFTP